MAKTKLESALNKKTKVKVPKATKPKRVHFTQKMIYQKYGIKSGLEEITQTNLNDNEIEFEYETLKLEYIVPEKKRSYKPDFIFPNKDNPKMIIETKGRWVKDDMDKMKMIKERYPDLDIRMVFTNSNSKVRKGSKTTYADICNKLNIPYADKVIPDDWLNEIKLLIGNNEA